MLRKSRLPTKKSAEWFATGLLAMVLGALLSCSPSSDSAQGPTFSEEVAPILFQHCVGCHRPESVAPFALLSYADARRRGRQIVEVTKSGYMPPWLPARDYGEFLGARRLSAAERSVLSRWVEAGAPEGPRSALPKPPEFRDGWLLGEPDLVVSMTSPFEMPAEGPDVFRNFQVPLEVEAGTRARALQFRPGNARLVHHAAVLADNTGVARQHEARDPEPGYPEMVGGSAPGGHFVGWTPGRGVVELEAGMPWVIEEGTDLVFQLHLLPSGRRESVQSSVGLYFTDEVPRRRPMSLHLFDTSLDIPAGEADYRAGDALVLPVDVDVFAIYPHAHYLGKDVRARAELPDGTEVPLLWIPAWNFDWQDEYRFKEPIFLPRGSRVELSLGYDNSEGNPRNPASPPRRVLRGPSSLDEMGDAWLKVVPRNSDDEESLARFLSDRESERFREGWQLRLSVNPEDGEALTRFGIGAAQRGEYARALEYLDRAAALLPAAWDSSYNRGVALAGRGRRAAAKAAYLEALELSPSDSKTHNALAGVLLLEGDTTGAVEHYRQALESRESSPLLCTPTSVALAQQGDVRGAESAYTRALTLDPNHLNALLKYDVLQSSIRRLKAAATTFQKILHLDPTHLEASKNLARTLNLQNLGAEAEGVLERALSFDPSDSELHYFLGLPQFRLQKIGEAIDAVERAVELDPSALSPRAARPQVELPKAATLRFFRSGLPASRSAGATPIMV